MPHRRLNEIAGVTHIGRRRSNNEDAIAWDPEFGLALVADGIGGNNAGEVASVTAARSIQTDVRAACGSGTAENGAESRDSRTALVQELVRRADQRIRSAAERDPSLSGMGTTLAMALLADDFVTVAHVGDSRVYRMCGGELERLTADHQLAVDTAPRSAADARGRRNVLTRALGTPTDATPEIAHHDLRAGDLYLLCSDGLTLAISDEELAKLLREQQGDLRATAEHAVALANRRGGRDNISIVLMRLA